MELEKYLLDENIPYKKVDGNITVYKGLYLKGSPVKELPDNLTVQGYLYLALSHIKKVPYNLVVSSWIDTRETGITKKKLKANGAKYTYEITGEDPRFK